MTTKPQTAGGMGAAAHPYIAEGLRHLATPIEQLTPDAANARRHSPRNLDAIKASLARWGQRFPIVVQRTGNIVRAGNGRLEAAKALGWTHIAALVVDDTSVDATAFAIADNRTAELAEWDAETLASLLDTLPDDIKIDTGFTDAEIAEALNNLTPNIEKTPGALAERFMVPPVTVLNARDGWWKNRKRAWLDSGIASSNGRDTNLVYTNPQVSFSDYYRQKNSVEQRLGRTLTNTEFNEKYLVLPKSEHATGTSVFDPVLCELLYRWFCPTGGTVLDPFAGGSVRGIVAGVLGRRYCGVDLRAEQVDANRTQAASFDAQHTAGDGITYQLPEWRVGDSCNIDKIAADVQADFILSCPPYADLEVYSDNPADLSTMDYDGFIAAYQTIIRKACDHLLPDRFAAFVVGEVRDKHGNYRDFVGDTVQAFRDAGLHFYNELILVTPIGNGLMRASPIFNASRKLVKTHQNVLVFVKGSGKAATHNCGTVDVTEVLPDADESTGDEQ